VIEGVKESIWINLVGTAVLVWREDPPNSLVPVLALDHKIYEMWRVDVGGVDVVRELLLDPLFVTLEIGIFEISDAATRFEVFLDVMLQR
jgi:hypothetical protein